MSCEHPSEGNERHRLFAPGKERNKWGVIFGFLGCAPLVYLGDERDRNDVKVPPFDRIVQVPHPVLRHLSEVLPLDVRHEFDVQL